jgi:hypothetical protein
MEVWIESMKEEGLPIPPPSTQAESIEVNLSALFSGSGWLFLISPTSLSDFLAAIIVMVFNRRFVSVEAFEASETPNRSEAKVIHNPVEGP